MYWYWFIFAVVALTTFCIIGIYLLYSAITGKGITPTDDNSSWQIKLQYKLRGPIGFGFTITSGLALFHLIKMTFER